MKKSVSSEGQKSIWTIGHSTRSIEDFLLLLEKYSIEQLADIRSYPGSRRYPHFNKEALQKKLTEKKIGYIHLPELGGRRKPMPDSHNTGWRNESFRGYADYMETKEFADAAGRLEEIAIACRTAYMCAEAVWWQCHRALVSDYLKVNGWTVWHIMNKGEVVEHPLTKPAEVRNGELSYRSSQLRLSQ